MSEGKNMFNRYSDFTLNKFSLDAMELFFLNDWLILQKTLQKFSQEFFLCVRNENTLLFTMGGREQRKGGEFKYFFVCSLPEHMRVYH